MAKEKKEETQEEKQVPEKPKKKSSNGGGDINLVTLIGIIGGSVVLMVTLLYFVLQFLIIPEFKNMNSGGSNNSEGNVAAVAHVEEVHSKEEATKFDFKKEEMLYPEEGVHLMETGKIITNPKGSTKFALANCALEYRTGHEDERFPVAEGEGGGEIDPSSNPILKKVLIRSQGKLNGVLGSMDIGQLQNLGADSLAIIFKRDLKPLFEKENMYLRDVIITQFLIQ